MLAQKLPSLRVSQGIYVQSPLWERGQREWVAVENQMSKDEAKNYTGGAMEIVLQELPSVDTQSP
jgi:hypothetical protein